MIMYRDLKEAGEISGSSFNTGEGKVMRGHIVGNRSPFDLWRAFILKSLI
jgi:hypothetical protein